MSTFQPIITQIAGIDAHARHLTDDEIKDMVTPVNGGLGDWFSQWLANTPVEKRQVTLRTLVGLFPTTSYKFFAIADGIPIVYDGKNTENPLNKISRSTRFVCLVLPDTAGLFNIDTSISSRTLFIVGGNFPDGTSPTQSGGFLQCASWDPNAIGKKQGMARFFERDERGWIYFGNGFNAFNSASANQGVFCGHVGGAFIMKELKEPWTHWFDQGNIGDFTASIGSTRTSASANDPHNVLYDPLFTAPDGGPFGLLERAQNLEPVVENAVASWYKSRFSNDFVGPSAKVLSASVIKAWTGHVLLNRAINIATSVTSTQLVQGSAANIGAIPQTLFFNADAMQIVLPDAGPPSGFTATNQAYLNAVSKLQLSLLDGNGNVAVKGSEGPFAFPILEPGVEDYAGVQTLFNNIGNITVLPAKAIAAMLMVDYFNPLYSARRESLMAYIPQSATFNAATKSYDILEQFIANVNASPASKDPTSVEFEVLQLLATPDNNWQATFTTRVNAYLTSVHNRLAATLVPSVEAAMEDYMTLAEGRRILYKGREDSKPDGSGLNEFPLTLPVAQTKVPVTRMKEDGTIEVMPEKDVRMFIKKAIPRTCPAHRRSNN